jgi:hypothetical protein
MLSHTARAAAALGRQTVQLTKTVPTELLPV